MDWVISDVTMVYTEHLKIKLNDMVNDPVSTITMNNDDAEHTFFWTAIDKAQAFRTIKRTNKNN